MALEDFEGRSSGDLIRARDWNGLVQTIRERFDALEADVAERTDALNATVDALDGRVRDIEGGIGRLTAIADMIETRHRRLTLATPRTRYVYGERATIEARVTDVLGRPLDLSNAATRPWVDFVCVWGSLKPAPGFTAREGTGGKSVTVQVNSDGVARALLREATGERFAEEQELDIAAVVETTSAGQSIGQMFLAASTPAATEITPAYAIVSEAYERADTTVMRSYLDTAYVAHPGWGFQTVQPQFSFTWGDDHATVMAFVKRDDDPGTADGAMATASIRVSFRDWIYPWLVGHYLEPPDDLVGDYRAQIPPLLNNGYGAAVTDIFDAIRVDAAEVGLLGQQRQIAAAQIALATLPVDNPPSYAQSAIEAVSGGLVMQKALAYSQAVSAGAAEDTSPGSAFGRGIARGESAAERTAATVAAQTASQIAAAEGRILDQVRSETAAFENNLLRDDGPLKQAEIFVQEARGDLTALKRDIGLKADVGLVSQLLNTRG